MGNKIMSISVPLCQRSTCRPTITIVGRAESYLKVSQVYYPDISSLIIFRTQNVFTLFTQVILLYTAVTISDNDKIR